MYPRRTLRPGLPVQHWLRFTLLCASVLCASVLCAADLSAADLSAADLSGVPSTAFAASPGVTTWVLPEAPRAGQPFTLVIEAAWSGPNDQFVLYPPILSLAGHAESTGDPAEQAVADNSTSQHAADPSAGSSGLPSGPPGGPSGASGETERTDASHDAPALLEKRGMTQSFQSQAGKTTYRYEYALVASSPGVLPLGSVSLRYRDMQAGASDPPAAPITLELPTVEIQPGGARGLIGQVLGGLLGVLTVGWLARRVRARLDKPSPPPPPAPPVTLEMLHGQARAAWISGQIDAVWAILQQARPLLSRQEDFLPPEAQLEESRLRARYGGGQATPELERLLDALGRCVAVRQKDAHRTQEE